MTNRCLGKARRKRKSYPAYCYGDTEGCCWFLAPFLLLLEHML